MKRIIVTYVVVLALLLPATPAGAVSAWWTCADRPHNASVYGGLGYKYVRADTAVDRSYRWYIAVSKYNPGHRYGAARAHLGGGLGSLWCGW